MDLLGNPAIGQHKLWFPVLLILFGSMLGGETQSEVGHEGCVYVHVTNGVHSLLI